MPLAESPLSPLFPTVETESARLFPPIRLQLTIIILPKLPVLLPNMKPTREWPLTPLLRPATFMHETMRAVPPLVLTAQRLLRLAIVFPPSFPIPTHVLTIGLPPSLMIAFAIPMSRVPTPRVKSAVTVVTTHPPPTPSRPQHLRRSPPYMRHITRQGRRENVRECS